jgi:Protein of unknown function (DUF3082)
MVEKTLIGMKSDLCINLRTAFFCCCCFLCRTIINGMCYLATFIFGINSAGLMIYALQLALGSNSDSDNSNELAQKNDGKQLNIVPPAEGNTPNVMSTNSELKQNPDNSTDSPQ